MPGLKNNLLKKILLTNFIGDSNVITLISNINFSYKDEDFNDPIVTDQDFEFMKFLTKDGEHWDVQKSFFNTQLIGSEDDTKVNTYWCPNTFQQDVSFLKGSNIVKYEYILDYPFEKVAPSVLSLDQRYKHDDSVNQIETLKYFSFDGLKKDYPHASDAIKEPRSHSLMKYDLYVSFFMNTRVWFPATSMKYDKDSGTLLHIVKSCKHDSGIDFMQSFDIPCAAYKGAKVKNAKAYIVFNFLSTSLKKISNDTTLFTQTGVIDLGGWGTNPIVLKYFAHDRSMKVYKMLINTIKTTNYSLSSIKSDVLKFPKDTYLKMLSEIEFEEEIE
jgi:hypothetical protein